jgi:hypothetical protein
MISVAAIVISLILGVAFSEHHQTALVIKVRVGEFKRDLVGLEQRDDRSSQEYSNMLRALSRAVNDIDADAIRICGDISRMHEDHGRVAQDHREKHRLNMELSRTMDRTNDFDKYRRIAELHAGHLHHAESRYQEVGAARLVCDDVLLTLDDMRGRLAFLEGEAASLSARDL